MTQCPTIGGGWRSIRTWRLSDERRGHLMISPQKRRHLFPGWWAVSAVSPPSSGSCWGADATQTGLASGRTHSAGDNRMHRARLGSRNARRAIRQPLHPSPPASCSCFVNWRFSTNLHHRSIVIAVFVIESRAREMPLRVKSRPLAQADPGLRTPPSPLGRHVQVRFGSELPDITVDDTFREVVKKLSVWVDSSAAPSALMSVR